MVWIKRNLFFVLSLAVGFFLLAGAGYYLWSGYSDNSAAAEDLRQKSDEYQKLLTANPQPTKEGIEKIKQSEKEIRDVLAQFGKTVSAQPFIAHKTDERTFKEFFDTTISRLQNTATNNGVGITLTPLYAFSFANLTGRLTFNSNSIAPLMEQIIDVEKICDVLIAAKVNFIEDRGIRRVPVCVEDQLTTDLLGTSAVTNEGTIRMPYEVSFRAYSGELAAALNGFMKSTNGFFIKNIDFAPSGASGAVFGTPALETVAQAPTLSSRSRYRRMRGPSPEQLAAAALTNQGPITVVSEKPLGVKLIVEVVKPVPPPPTEAETAKPVKKARSR